MSADIGVIGLAVMGQNLVLNMIDNNYTVAVYNRSENKTKDTVARVKNKEKIIPCYSLIELIESLKETKIILMMVKAGDPVDSVINDLKPHLSSGDIIIDGGNSNFMDTIRRHSELNKLQIGYVGMGISGGEEGARNGPSIMPGGSPQAWSTIKNIFQDISAKKDGNPCCRWLGSDGAGHFVKTVHNGIEYGDMQLIAETYDILRNGIGIDIDSIANIFNVWNKGELESYLIEITGVILSKKDEETGNPLVDMILDKAGQKGTGRWTVHSSLEMAIPAFLIGAAVFQRFLSAQKEQRISASRYFDKSKPSLEVTIDEIVNDIENALLVSKIISYAQGFELMKTASIQYSWDLDLGNVAAIWRDGCIIRSKFLDDITHAFKENPLLETLLMNEHFKRIVMEKIDSLRRIVKLAVDLQISIPGFSSALSYFDGFTSSKLPANIIQAQRDYFGAHGYQRIDKNGSFHTKWSI